MWFAYVTLITFLSSSANMEDEMKVSFQLQRFCPQKKHL